MDLLDNQMWAYHAVFKQTNAGGGAVTIKIIANERTAFLFGMFGADDYAADRTITGFIHDGTNVIARIFFPSPVDNEQVPMWGLGAAAIVHGQAQDFSQPIVLGKGDMLQYTVATLVQNEEITMALRALVKSWPPSISTTGSAGTVTITQTYNEMI